MVAQPKKKSAQRPATFGKGGATKMFKPQAAGTDRPGNTGKDQSPAPGAQRAVGGPRTTGHSLSLPAAAGHTAPPRKGRGGEARKALPGQCGT
jgi:hypothetical protein